MGISNKKEMLDLAKKYQNNIDHARAIALDVLSAMPTLTGIQAIAYRSNVAQQLRVFQIINNSGLDNDNIGPILESRYPGLVNWNTEGVRYRAVVPKLVTIRDWFATNESIIVTVAYISYTSVSKGDSGSVPSTLKTELTDLVDSLLAEYV